MRVFPYQDGRTRRLSAPRWGVALAGAVAGFLLLSCLPQVVPGDVGRWLGVLALPVAPLLGLVIAAGRDWAALFHRPTWRDVLVGLIFAPASLVVSFAAGLAASRFTQVNANPVHETLGAMDWSHRLEFLIATAPQLVGEELITAIVFLALLALLRRAPRPLAIGLACLGSALVFGALHLPTYGWNAIQALGVIGLARVVLFAPYLITKNLWSSALAHVVNDWTLFLLGLLIVARI